MTLTEQERDAMAHAIGHHSAKGCSVHGGRNYYVTAADDPMWLSDPEAMPDDRREALLDAARDVAEAGGIPAWLEFERACGLTPRDAWRLAEDAGFWAVAPAQGGPKEQA